MEQRPAWPSRRRAAGCRSLVGSRVLPASSEKPKRSAPDAAALGVVRARPGAAGPSGCSEQTPSFPAKLEERRSEDARLAPQPGAKGTSPSPGATALPSRRGRSGSRTQERHLKGLGARRPLRARPKWFCAVLCAQARSLRSPLQTQATRLGSPAFTPSPGSGRGSPAQPGSWGPVPASRQAGKLGSPGAAVSTSKRPAGPCRETRGRGRQYPSGARRDRLAAAGAAAWHPPHGRSEAALAYLRRPGPRGRPGGRTRRARGSAPWWQRRPGPASFGRSLRLSAGPARAGGCRGSSSLSRRGPLLWHHRRGCPISAAGTGARDVTLRAPPAQSPPPVRAARPPATQTRGASGRCAEQPGAHSGLEDSRRSRAISAAAGARGALPALALWSPAADELSHPPTHSSSPLALFRAGFPKSVLSRCAAGLNQQL